MFVAKAKEIKYAILSKTADSHGVYYFTKDNINYIGNIYIVVRGMNDEEFRVAIEKAKAEKLDKDDTIDIAVNHVNEVKNKGYHAAYTKLCFNSASGLVHFFKADNGLVINLYDKFYALLKEQQVSHIFGLSPERGLVFELNDGKDIMILPIRLSLNGIEAENLEKVLDIL